MSTIMAKDLTKDFPRSPYEELGGFPWLPRLIDKVRALQAGKIGDYTPFPCGGDRNFLDALGIDPAALKAEIDRGASDAEIAAWVKAHAAAGHEAKVNEYKSQATAPITGGDYLGYLTSAKAELEKAKPGIDLSKVTNFAQLLCVEEGHTLPA
jgi:hypothetical protein